LSKEIKTSLGQFVTQSWQPLHLDVKLFKPEAPGGIIGLGVFRRCCLVSAGIKSPLKSDALSVIGCQKIPKIAPEDRRKARREVTFTDEGEIFKDCTAFRLE
jgi:hypothetical protein